LRHAEEVVRVAVQVETENWALLPTCPPSMRKVIPVSLSQAPLLMLVIVRSGSDTDAEIAHEHAAPSGEAAGSPARSRAERGRKRRALPTALRGDPWMVSCTVNL
jgi:hypothetical protein